jgi:hypothetical protein
MLARYLLGLMKTDECSRIILACHANMLQRTEGVL